MAQISLIILITDTRYWIEGDDIELAYSLTFYSNYVGMPEAIQISTANEKKKNGKKAATWRPVPQYKCASKLLLVLETGKSTLTVFL